MVGGGRGSSSGVVVVDRGGSWEGGDRRGAAPSGGGARVWGRGSIFRADLVGSGPWPLVCNGSAHQSRGTRGGKIEDPATNYEGFFLKNIVVSELRRDYKWTKNMSLTLETERGRTAEDSATLARATTCTSRIPRSTKVLQSKNIIIIYTIQIHNNRCRFRRSRPPMMSSVLRTSTRLQKNRLDDLRSPKKLCSLTTSPRGSTPNVTSLTADVFSEHGPLQQNPSILPSAQAPAATNNDAHLLGQFQKRRTPHPLRPRTGVFGGFQLVRDLSEEAGFLQFVETLVPLCVCF